MAVVIVHVGARRHRCRDAHTLLHNTESLLQQNAIGIVLKIHLQQIIARQEYRHILIRQADAVMHILLKRARGELTVFDIGLIKAVDIVAFNDLRRLPRSIAVKQRIAHIATLGVDVVKLHTHTVVASEFDHWRCVIVGFQTSAQRPHRLVENACRRVGGISQRRRQHKQ